MAFLDLSEKYTTMWKVSQQHGRSWNWTGEIGLLLPHPVKLGIFFFFFFGLLSAHEPEKGHVSRVTGVTGLGHHY